MLPGDGDFVTECPWRMTAGHSNPSMIQGLDTDRSMETSAYDGVLMVDKLTGVYLSKTIHQGRSAAPSDHP